MWLDVRWASMSVRPQGFARGPCLRPPTTAINAPCRRHHPPQVPELKRMAEEEVAAARKTEGIKVCECVWVMCVCALSVCQAGFTAHAIARSARLAFLATAAVSTPPPQP
jgi:hypothetical protein